MSQYALSRHPWCLTGICLVAGFSAQAATPPNIAKVVLSGKGGSYSATLTGKGFGASPVALPCNACSIPELGIIDAAQVYLGEQPNITGWSDGQITLTNVSGNAGDAMYINVEDEATSKFGSWGGTLPGAPHATIKSVAVSGTGQTAKITVTGSGFGATPPAGVPGTADTANFEVWIISESKSGDVSWSAGYVGQGYTDSVQLNYASWTDTKIVIDGFGSAYGSNGWTFDKGDPFVVNVFSTAGSKQAGKAGRVK